MGKKEKLAESLWKMGKEFRVQDEIPNDKFHTIVLLLCNRESLRSSQLSTSMDKKIIAAFYAYLPFQCHSGVPGIINYLQFFPLLVLDFHHDL